MEAAWAVAALVGGRPERHPAPGHDYDVHLDGRVIALEVTTSTREEVKASNAARSKLQQREIVGLSHNWTVEVSLRTARGQIPDLREVLGRAPSLLGRLEQSNCLSLDHSCLPTGPEPLREAIEALRELGVAGASSLGPVMRGERPWISVGATEPAGVISASDVNAAAERAASRKLSQLAGARADERHLFVVVEVADHATSAALTVGLYLPDRPPSLPTGIDTVWVGAWSPWRSFGCQISPIWRATPPAAWERMEPPDAHGYAAGIGEVRLAAKDEEAYRAVREELSEIAQHVRRQLRPPA